MAELDGRNREGPILVALVGVDGSGKSTQAARLADALDTAGIPARFAPNESLLPYRRTVHDVALARGFTSAGQMLGKDTYRYGLAVAKWMHYQRIWRDATAFTGITVTDRYYYCQLARARASGVSAATYDVIERLLESLPSPSLTIWIDVDPELAHERVLARGRDEESLDDLRRFRSAYTRLASRFGFVRVNGDGTPEAVAEDVRQEALAALDVSRAPALARR